MNGMESKLSEPIILDIGIDICLSCPYPDCISTDTELCHLIRDEADRVKKRAIAEKQSIEQKMIDNILAAVKRCGSLTLPEIRELCDYKYKDLAQLVRQDKLPVKRIKHKHTNKNVILVIDRD